MSIQQSLCAPTSTRARFSTAPIASDARFSSTGASRALSCCDKTKKWQNRPTKRNPNRRSPQNGCEYLRLPSNLDIDDFSTGGWLTQQPPPACFAVNATQTQCFAFVDQYANQSVFFDASGLPIASQTESSWGLRKSAIRVRTGAQRWPKGIALRGCANETTQRAAQRGGVPSAPPAFCDAPPKLCATSADVASMIVSRTHNASECVARKCCLPSDK